MPTIHVKQIPVGLLTENCYLVSNEDTNECVIVDPGAEDWTISDAIGRQKPVAVLLTHAHFDHIGAVDALCSRYDIPLYVHKLDIPKLTDSEQNVAAYFEADMTVKTKPTAIEGGMVLHLAGIDFTVMHTPGHSSGSVCYRLPGNEGILTGDTLFAYGYGRTDFPDGDFSLIRKSLRDLYHITPKIRSYPGHGECGWAGRDRGEEA